ncbi:hypothetical protein Clacol_007437 [Clathrus columnatus]|uniref:Uncharacterized protein n=1 Tax=Clathrus columnatus TaxID=1419009 RepID=A0AAV5AEW5_9AGAM|nr:hypothetical protein Clacol_007437 [Clathrus columnatus]
MTSFSKSELIRALSEVQYGIKSYRFLEDMCDVHQAVSEVDLLENQQIKVMLTAQGYEVLKDNDVLDPQIYETLEQLLSNQNRLLSHFSMSVKPVIIEHGNPSLAPFLGREFVGLEGVQNYFRLLAQTVSYDNMEFTEYLVDVQEKKVAAKGQAVFTWEETQQTWDETFVYVLHFDIMYRVTRYEVWADSGAAYLARIGQLDGGGSFASSSDGSRAVIAGNDVLRLVKVSDVNRQNVLQSNPRLCVGPGGATIETSPNMWLSSGLKVDSAPTDVIWGRGDRNDIRAKQITAFDNKIVTSARNGEIIYWDISRLGNKFESRVREHKRAVNQLALSPFLPYMFVSGSQDGYLRLWDLRSPSSSVLKVYHATGIRTVALCPVPSHPMHVCVGLESGTIQRWDLRSKAQPLERITLAHSCAVLSMDWQSPSMQEGGLGWIVTSGMDRHVKVWDLTTPGLNGTTIAEKDKLLSTKKMGITGPLRTLHPSFVVRHVRWRQGSDTEVAARPSKFIVSNTDSDGESIVEIWDIRRGWIGKWAIQSGTEGVEGSVTGMLVLLRKICHSNSLQDIAFASNDIVHALHTSGAFVQYDLQRSLVKPLDAVPRNAISWSAAGDMAFVAGLKYENEIPFDDVGEFDGPTESPQPHKSTSDPPYVPTDQMLGVFSIIKGGTPNMSADFNSLLGVDTSRVARLAKRYVFRPQDPNIRKKDICIANAKARFLSFEEDDLEARRVWTILADLLSDESVSENTGKEIRETNHTSPAPSPSVPLVPGTRSMSITINSRSPEDSLTKPARNSSSSSSPITRPPMGTAVSAPSPRNRSITPVGLSQESNEPSVQDPQRSPVSIYDASISSSGLGGLRSESIARKSPPIFPAHTRPAFRRASVTVADPLMSPVGRIGGISHPHVGEGALDSSDEDDDTQKSEGSDGGIQRRSTWSKSQLTTMIEEYKKPRGDRAMSMSSGWLSEENRRTGGEGTTSGLMTRSGSAKSFAESLGSLPPQRPLHPRLSLSPIQDIDQHKPNSVNTKSGSASTSSSSSKVQLIKNQQTLPSESLSSSSSSFSKHASQGTTQSQYALSIPSLMQARSAKALPSPSPLSRVFTPQSRREDGSATSVLYASESPDRLADDEEYTDYESGSGSGSDSEEIMSDMDSDMEVEDGSEFSQRPSSRSLARSDPIPLFVSGARTSMDSSSWNLREGPRAPSKSSVRTVTVAVPSRPASILSEKPHRYAKQDSAEEVDQASASERVTVVQESLASTRRPSLAGDAIGSGAGLGLSNMTADDTGGGNESVFNVSIHRLRPTNLAVPSMEQRWRDLAWKGVRKNFEGLSEIGDVQMCALLAMVVPKELKLNKAAASSDESFNLNVVDVKIRIAFAFETSYASSSCSLRLLFILLVESVIRRLGQYRGLAQYYSARNVIFNLTIAQFGSWGLTYPLIIHLPVRSLFIHCSICGHGGHQACYRTYMSTHLPVEIPPSDSQSSLSFNPFTLFMHSANSLSYFGSSWSGGMTPDDGSTSTYYSFSDTNDNRTTASGDDDNNNVYEEDSDVIKSSNPAGSEQASDGHRKTRVAPQTRMQVLGYACPTGCGHWCWGVNERIQKDEKSFQS